MVLRWLGTVVVFLSVFDCFAKPIVIAHRGASGYLPEHTLEAKALAYGQGADYIEQDVVMTKDDQLIVFHDLYLERVSDVVTKFPNRARKDGHYYVIDFTLAEIQQLNVSEGFSSTKSGQLKANYPNRFPLFKSTFKVHTLAQEIELIQGLNHSTGKDVGLYPEIKSPWFHLKENKDISHAVLLTLKRYGYQTRKQKIFIQSFDANELQRIKQQLMPSLQLDLPLVQLVAYTDWQETKELKQGVWQNYNYDWMFSSQGVKRIKSYADGIGPWYPMLVDVAVDSQNVNASDFFLAAKANGLAVHAYTFRADPGQIPKYANSFEDYVSTFVSLGLDGFFTDFPDKVLHLVD